MSTESQKSQPEVQPEVQESAEQTPESLETAAMQAKKALNLAVKHLGMSVEKEDESPTKFTVWGDTQFGQMKMTTSASEKGEVVLIIYEVDSQHFDTHALLKIDFKASHLSSATLEEWVQRATTLKNRIVNMEKPVDRVPSDPRRWSEEKGELHKKISPHTLPGIFTPKKIETLEPLMDAFEAAE
jgi:hypothetical protein